MKTMTWALAWAALLLAALSPTRGGAQSQLPAGAMMAQAAIGMPADSGGLAPSEIIARVRSAGFGPLSRPVQRGGVYILFALDRQYMDVRVTVDASSGRVLSATRLAGTRYGGPGYEGYEERSTVYERPPVPPGEIPNRGTARNVGSATPSPPHLPLPRARPGGDVTGSVKETVPQADAEPRAEAPPAGLGDTTVETAPPLPATLRPQQPTMLPIAPLE
jgi:hypothetical protein